MSLPSSSSSPLSRPPLNIVLLEPEIPPNTGNIGRLCATTFTRLHLIEPLGFSINDRELKRAGMDYWKEVDWRLYPNWAEFLAVASDTCAALGIAQPRLWFFTTKSPKTFWQADFQPGDYLVLGRESKGLPESLLAENPERCIRIPQFNPQARSLNLGTAAGIGLFEAIRQTQMHGTAID
ncbi:MAG: tRNA (cytidine(34)-2'-O)-methyltransferase [Candidatus Methylacidiphilales bacterium]|nr:tRNA (cytidine(34)-2'-O)-methyltransferase [Candidatus Methylacidiphilales bacterium]